MKKSIVALTLAALLLPSFTNVSAYSYRRYHHPRHGYYDGYYYKDDGLGWGLALTGLLGAAIAANSKRPERLSQRELLLENSKLRDALIEALQEIKEIRKKLNDCLDKEEPARKRIRQR